MDLLEQFRDLSLACEVTPNSVRLGTLRITSELLGDIREGHKTDPFLRNQLEAIESRRDSSFNVGSDGALQLQDRICVPNVLELRKIILEEGHRSNLSIHPGATKILSSAYHPQTDGETEWTIHSLKDLLRVCVLEQKGSWESFLPLIEFTYNNSFHSTIGMAPYEALYGRRCRTPLCWLELREDLTLGPEVVQQTTEKVKLIQ
ncbi:uncharacterized protein [Glycine max]|uniref:uncharacterized protein n=1 Tax=Glycine max TaxID=3847 RepID=UPI0003DE7E35|nr:uncharacterized protein LOC102662248 [Glycine max]|eukprot:XP_006598523.1 uncharacterized protein LOC102662248 [Glycine max]